MPALQKTKKGAGRGFRPAPPPWWQAVGLFLAEPNRSAECLADSIATSALAVSTTNLALRRFAHWLALALALRRRLSLALRRLRSDCWGSHHLRCGRCWGNHHLCGRCDRWCDRRALEPCGRVCLLALCHGVPPWRVGSPPRELTYYHAE